jgi:hypothetical protein
LRTCFSNKSISSKRRCLAAKTPIITLSPIKLSPKRTALSKRKLSPKNLMNTLRTTVTRSLMEVIKSLTDTISLYRT